MNTWQKQSLMSLLGKCQQLVRASHLIRCRASCTVATVQSTAFLPHRMGIWWIYHQEYQGVILPSKYFCSLYANIWIDLPWKPNHFTSSAEKNIQELPDCNMFCNPQLLCELQNLCKSFSLNIIGNRENRSSFTNFLHISHLLFVPHAKDNTACCWTEQPMSTSPFSNSHPVSQPNDSPSSCIERWNEINQGTNWKKFLLHQTKL